MVILTGIIKPILSAVLALYSLQNAEIFTPCWPNAGPIGGAGVAFPAVNDNFTKALTFFFYHKYKSNILRYYKLLYTF